MSGATDVYRESLTCLDDAELDHRESFTQSQIDQLVNQLLAIREERGRRWIDRKEERGL